MSHIFHFVLFPVNMSTLVDEDQELSTDRKLPLGPTLSRVYMRVFKLLHFLISVERNSFQLSLFLV